MTRIVVQRTVNTYGSTQGRQSSSAPTSTSTSVPSSANSSTSSHPPAQTSCAPCGEGGRDGEAGNCLLEDDLSHELNSRLTASTGAVEGSGNERFLANAYGQSEGTDSSSSFHYAAEDGERAVQLTSSWSLGESSEGRVLIDHDLEKGKEVAEEGRSQNSSTGDGIQGDSSSEDLGGVQSRTADEEELNVQNKLTATCSHQSSSSQSLPASAAPASPPSHNNNLSDAAPVHEPDLARPSSPQSPPEAVGCSYLYAAAASPPLSSSASRRGSWLGSSVSAAPPRGGLSRRGQRVGKSSRNSPNSSHPSSPRSYGEGDGYNSADEQNPRSSSYEHNGEREHQFEVEIRNSKNLEVRRMAGDGNCLFRAVADQVYGDAEMYDETRQMCIDYMEKERDHFSQFVTESFTAYCKRKRRDKVYGNNLEIQAMAEMYNRPIHIYSYSLEPINIFHGSYETDLPPIRLSYHRGNHYNSLIDPGRSAVGVGLGFGSLRGTNVDREQVKAALKAQQDQQIDKALLAEGSFYSDIELTEQEIHRMVMEASRAEFFEEEKHRQYAPWSEQTSTSAAAEPSSSGTTGSPKSAVRTMSLAATSTTSTDSAGLTPNVRMLMSMGFSYLEVMEACSIFGDDVNNMLCYLLETDGGSSGAGESMYRKKGKAAER